MILSTRHSTGTHAIAFRRAALFACTVALPALLLLTSERREAKAAGGNTAPAGYSQGATFDGEARFQSPTQETHQSGFSPVMSKILPFGVLTNSFSLVPGQAYSLIYSDTALGQSSSFLLDFNGMAGSTSVLNAWVDCGYNPLVGPGEWPIWCPQHANTTGAEGPTMYWLGSKSPTDGPYYDRSLAAGKGLTGWWLDAAPATSTSLTCGWIGRIASLDNPEYVIPLADIDIPGGGAHSSLHLRALHTFRIQNSYAVCNPPPGESRSWYLEGVMLPK
jgi:hypothetical protein